MSLQESTVTLGDMAERLGAELGIHIQAGTPYAWWRRDQNETLPVPMPKPDMWIGQRSPVWSWPRILIWYKTWKGLA